MTVKVFLEDGNGRGSSAQVTRNGEVLTRPYYAFNTSYRVVLTTTNMTNVVSPKESENFVCTSVIINATRSVTGEASVTFSESQTSAGTSTKDIITLDVAKDTTIDLANLNLLVPAGKFINVITDDATVNITILGYHMPDQETA